MRKHYTRKSVSMAFLLWLADAADYYFYLLLAKKWRTNVDPVCPQTRGWFLMHRTQLWSAVVANSCRDF